LLLIALLPQPSAGAKIRSPSLNDPEQLLFSLCLENVRCSTAFYLPPPAPDMATGQSLTPDDWTDYDARLFTTLLTELQNKLGFSYQSAPFSCILDSGGVNDSDCQAWWLLTMSQASFCTANEEYILGLGCECPSGSLCTAAAPSDISWNLFSFAVAGILLMVGVIYFGGTLLRKLVNLINLYLRQQAMISLLVRRQPPQLSPVQTATGPHLPIVVPPQQNFPVLGGTVIRRPMPVMSQYQQQHQQQHTVLL
jgi:hypothetical protein